MSRLTRKLGRKDWETPPHVFGRYLCEFGITTDVCATPENAKCVRYFTPEMDAFKQKWTGVCWMNPPYGRGITQWIKKAYDSAVTGDATVVCLLPNSTDTIYFHDYCAKGEVRFIKGRIKFVGAKRPPEHGSIIVIFHAHLDPGRIMRCES